MTPAEGRLLTLLMQNPLPEVRRQGMKAYEAGQSRYENRYNPATQPIEWLNWDAGWNDERQENS